MPFIGSGRRGFTEARQQKFQTARRATPQFVGNPNEIGSELEAKGLNEFNAADQRFAGVTEAVFNQANQVGLSQAVEQSGFRADQAFSAQESSIQRRQRSLGLNLTERQQKSQGRRLSLSRELAKASAKGSTRRGFRDRAEVARRAGGQFEDALFDIEAQTELGLSNAAGQERIRIEQERAAKKARTASIISSVIGIGAAFLSDETMKVSKREISLLDRLKKIRIQKWKYVGEDADHIGPYAQEFNDVFGVGQDDNTKISVIDVMGVTLGAVKELSEKLDG